MKERVRFAVGAASMVLAACCLMGALFTAWLRCAAGAVTQAAGWAVMQQLDLKEQPWAAGTGLQAGGTPHRVRWRWSRAAYGAMRDCWIRLPWAHRPERK